MELIDKLNAIEEIKILKSRYLRFVDTKNWGGMRDIFCTDAILDLRYSAEVVEHYDPIPEGTNPRVFRSADAILEFLIERIGLKRTVHQGHCHEVEILDEREARGIIALEDRIMDENGENVMMHGWGHYHEEYRYERGAWRIFSSRVTRQHINKPA